MPRNKLWELIWNKRKGLATAQRENEHELYAALNNGSETMLAEAFAKRVAIHQRLTLLDEIIEEAKRGEAALPDAGT
jgi:hypothetical protein